jgi:AcrR family transcriptional regulator
MKDTRAAIVESAFRLFIERGYEGASMADLVAVTGLSKGAVYHHFRDKDALHDAAIEHFFLRFFGPDEGAAPAGDEGLEAVLADLCAGYVRLMDAISTVVSDRTAYYRFVFSILPKVKDQIRGQIVDARTRIAAAASFDRDRGALAESPDSNGVADHCLALIEGTALLCVVEGREDIAPSLEQSIENYMRLLRR